jgi:hypothetical protein
MSKDKEQYLDRNSAYGSGRRRRNKGGGVLIGVILLVILAIGCGVTAYKLAQKHLGEKGNDLGWFLNEGRLTPTPTPTASPTVGPSPTPTPTSSPTPTPFVPPTFESEYLKGFDDFRDPLVNIAKAGFDCSAYNEGNPFEAKGVYVGHMSKDSAIYNNITWIASGTELNAVIIDVKDDLGYITYDMDLDIVKELGLVAPEDGKFYISDMPGLLDDLHSKGIYCIARIVCFKESYFDHSSIFNLHPEWLLKKKNGELFRDKTVLNGESKPYAWMNPYNRDALEFIVKVAEQAAKDGFDEICFDYMRTPTDVTLSELDFGEESEMISYSEQIVRFIRYACNRLKPLGVYVSGSVYGITIDSKVDSENLGQDYKELSKYLDFICPMIYPSHYGTDYWPVLNVNEHPYDLVGLEIRGSEKKLQALKEEWTGHVAVCRPWLQAFNSPNSVYDYGKIRVQVSACNDNGVFTWMYWNSSGSYQQEYFLTDEEEAEQNAARKKE